MIRKALSTPWKVRTELQRQLIWPLARLRFALNGISWGKNWRLYGVPIIHRHRESLMQIGNDLKLRSALTSNPLGPSHPVFFTTWEARSRLIIGDDFAMTGGVICAASTVRIGNHVMIGANCIIIDTDFHPINADLRRRDPMETTPCPITIEDDVFVGMQSIILKGVTIGRGSVVGAGSVVARDVPPKVVVAGNPAAIIKALH